MPSFRTVNYGQAWSDQSGQNTSQRVGTNDPNRPEAEVKLSKRKLEIRTGANAKRARGPWVGFKRFFTAMRYDLFGNSRLGRFVGLLSVNQVTKRKLRHEEYNFDRKVNELVESLVENPKLSTKEISKQLNEIAEHGEYIKNNAEPENQDITSRFKKNFEESLNAVGRKSPLILKMFERKFSQGSLKDLSTDYTYLNSKGTDLFESFRAHEMNRRQGIHEARVPNRREFVEKLIDEEDLRDPKQHQLVQDFISEMKSLSTDSGIRRTAQRDEFEFHRQAPKTAVQNLGTPNSGPFKGTISCDLKGDPTVAPLFRNRQPGTLNQVNGTQVSKRFLIDVHRIDCSLTNWGDRTESINPNLGGRTNERIQPIEEYAVNQLGDFVGRLPISPVDKGVAIRNLSGLLNQDLVKPLQTPVNRKMEQEMGFYATPSPPKDESAVNTKIDVSVGGRGLLINVHQETKVEGLPRPNHETTFVTVDPNRNHQEFDVQLRVSFDELVQETMNVEVLKAGYKLNLNFDS